MGMVEVAKVEEAMAVTAEAEVAHPCRVQVPKCAIRRRRWCGTGCRQWWPEACCWRRCQHPHQASIHHCCPAFARAGKHTLAAVQLCKVGEWHAWGGAAGKQHSQCPGSNNGTRGATPSCNAPSNRPCRRWSARMCAHCRSTRWRTSGLWQLPWGSTAQSLPGGPQLQCPAACQPQHQPKPAFNALPQTSCHPCLGTASSGWGGAAVSLSQARQAWRQAKLSPGAGRLQLSCTHLATVAMAPAVRLLVASRNGTAVVRAAGQGCKSPPAGNLDRAAHGGCRLGAIPKLAFAIVAKAVDCAALEQRARKGITRLNRLHSRWHRELGGLSREVAPCSQRPAARRGRGEGCMGAADDHPCACTCRVRSQSGMGAWLAN